MIIECPINDTVAKSESIVVYVDGKQANYSFDDVNYAKIMNGWRDMTANAHEMPAFGVSLNDETLAALCSGVWVEFVFDRQLSHNDMPFEKLLVEVNRLWQGFNIVRYNSNNGYSGRCFYFDLNGKNMSNFYDILLNL